MEGRRRRFEPQSHPRWQIVEISNRPPNLSAKQSELTVRTKKPSAKQKKHSAKEKLYFAQKLPQDSQKLPQMAKICSKFAPKSAPNYLLRTFFDNPLRIR